MMPEGELAMAPKPDVFPVSVFTGTNFAVIDLSPVTVMMH